jgi:uncharacterized membrane protein YheB (UPF0754 family)
VQKEMNYWLLLIPVISGFIGWITNWVAIKMLFHPRKPILILGYPIQGIFPKRQAQFAGNLGKLVSQELISFSDISTKLTDPSKLNAVIPALEERIDTFLRVKLSESFPMISMFIGDKTIEKLKGIFVEELKSALPELIQKYIDQLKDELDLEKIVTEKVAAFSTDKLERLIYQVMASELKFVEILGGVLGFLIGLLQVAITLLSQ